MRHALERHPDSLRSAVSEIEVEVVRRSGRLAFHYLVTGSIDDILLPRMTSPARADDLWKHSCFEAFIRSPGGEDYLELNFAPSGSWAAYRFEGYRAGVRNADIAPPHIETQTRAERFMLSAELALPGEGPLGLAAVIEETNGRKSYWALAHPPGAPDFHHADCFALELPPSGAP